ncbi:hypothetical protein J0S82_010465 [Galemys pyrenaicus]|uniref:Uncharacterized protein n=1 Tax=Galemys pyrenaicus TaxID=202257 RepID=A0A8J6A3B0_GALPY|nr:hypothetical protein J0S82_010465 [Galemys pyrenaicus]
MAAPQSSLGERELCGSWRPRGQRRAGPAGVRAAAPEVLGPLEEAQRAPREGWRAGPGLLRRAGAAGAGGRDCPGGDSGEEQEIRRRPCGGPEESSGPLRPAPRTHVASGVDTTFEEPPPDATWEECEPDEALGPRKCAENAALLLQLPRPGRTPAWSPSAREEGGGGKKLKPRENEKDIESEVEGKSDLEQESESEEESEREEANENRGEEDMDDDQEGKAEVNNQEGVSEAEGETEAESECHPERAMEAEWPRENICTTGSIWAPIVRKINSSSLPCA